MKKKVASKLYVHIFSSFLCIVAFASVVLIAASSWFTAQYEKLLYQQNEKTIEVINEQLTHNIQSVYELCEVIVDNQIVTENLRPYATLTPTQRYQYGAIIKLLYQGRLQMNGLIDSLFLYADSEKVLFAKEDKGMANFDTFFEKLMHFGTYDEQFWAERLQESNRLSAVLFADSYQSSKVNDQREVIPILYTGRGRASNYVLAINLSLRNILREFKIIEVYPGILYSVYSTDGQYICGISEPSGFAADNKILLDGKEYYCFEAMQDSIRIRIQFYMPKGVIGTKIVAYQTIAILLIASFSIAGVLLVLTASRRAYAPIRIVKKDIQSMPDGELMPKNGNEIELIRGTLLRLNDERSLYQSRNRQHSDHYIIQSIAALLEGKLVNDMAYFNMLLTRDYGFSGSSFFCAGVVMDLEDGEDYVLRKEMVERMKDDIETALGQTIPLLCFAYQSNMLILLADGSDNAADMCRNAFNKLKLMYSNSINLRFGIGGCISSPEQIIESYYQANTEILLFDSDYQAAGEFVYEKNEIRSAAFSRDILQIEEVTRNVLERARGHRLTYKDTSSLLDDICNTIIDTLRKTNAGNASFLPRKENVNALKVLLLNPEINLIPLTAIVLPHITAPAAKEESNTDRLANQAKKYIEEHYQEELSLDILADKLQTSPKYLSRIFKQIIGVNLSEYLMYIRVENAKKLLVTELSMNDIMEKVGISNRATFARTFKRLEGVTPNEYRLLHR